MVTPGAPADRPAGRETAERMATLQDNLKDPKRRQAIVDDACQVLDQEVAAKSGITGLAVKGAYKVVKGVKPGFIRETVDHLLDDFVRALEPIYEESVQKGEPAGRYLESNRSRMADALLAITDGRAERAKNLSVKKLYGKLRPTAKKHVEAAAPRLGRLLERHAA